MKPGVHRQDPFLRPTPVPVRAFLGRKRPIRPPATMAGDLPRDNRLMPPKNHRDRPTRQPTRQLPRNHLPFLRAQHHTPHPTPLATHTFLDNHRRYSPTYPLAHSPYDCKLFVGEVGYITYRVRQSATVRRLGREAAERERQLDMERGRLAHATRAAETQRKAAEEVRRESAARAEQAARDRAREQRQAEERLAREQAQREYEERQEKARHQARAHAHEDMRREREEEQAWWTRRAEAAEAKLAWANEHGTPDDVRDATRVLEDLLNRWQTQFGRTTRSHDLHETLVGRPVPSWLAPQGSSDRLRTRGSSIWSRVVHRSTPTGEASVCAIHLLTMCRKQGWPTDWAETPVR